MDRLTYRDETGRALLCDYSDDLRKQSNAPTERLAAYEDAGIEPEEINRLRSELAKVTAERDALKPNRHCKWQDGEVCMHPFNQPENCLIGPCNLQRKPTHEP